MPEPMPQPVSCEPTVAKTRLADEFVTRIDDETPRGVERPPERFGDYELIGEVARGGMGVVYRARQVTLDRIVALKMILAGRLADDDDVQRFRREAEAAARLQHPNIVAIFEIGEIEGQHFFSMEFISGISLSRKLADGPVDGRQAANYVRSIARAVHHAHRQGIIHRDLKPSNILLTADGTPRVSDFGLARSLDSDGVNLHTPRA